MAHHECSSCPHMKGLEDEHGRMVYFCMYSESPAPFEEVSICGECDIDDDTEEWNGGFDDGGRTQAHGA